MRNQVDWRFAYEPFKGKVWEFGMYEIREKNIGPSNRWVPMYDVYHDGRLMRAFPYWCEADRWVRGVMV